VDLQQHAGLQLLLAQGVADADHRDLDDVRRRASNGSAAGQYSSSTSSNQQWTEVTAAGNTRFQNRATGLYLDGMGRTADGSDLGQYAGSTSTNQQWTLVSAS